MAQWYGRLIERVTRTECVESFRFTPESAVTFIPGQFVQVILDEGVLQNKTLNKYLSFSASPDMPYIEVTKKLTQSEFSHRLSGLAVGMRVLFNGPVGKCVLAPEMTKVAFIAGGIGITPVISIIQSIVEHAQAVDVCLLYSNWSEKDIAFKHELDMWQAAFPRLRVVHTLVNCDEGGSYYKGMLDAQKIGLQMPDYHERDCFIFGPPKMVEAMKGFCRELGCDPLRVKAETFVGYE